MSLKARIEADTKEAQKRGERSRVDTLRFVLAQIHNAEIEKRTGGDSVLSDEETVVLLGREVKKRKEAIELFRKGHREDLVRAEEASLLFLEPYLPKQLTEEEIAAAVGAIRARGITDFNALMKEAMKALKGRADGKIVSEVIRKQLG